MSNKFTRTSPEMALRIASKEKRGKLKIFLGYAPGVGKTYSMLNEAKRRIKYGQNVVIGYIEPHYRKDTEKNKQGIKEIPLKEIAYKGKIFYEPDIEKIIEYMPETVLIDELAHSNAPTSKNYKRYEDVLEILSKGINVLTTLNIQHIETLNFLAYNITRVDVSEIVPYEVVDNADEVIVVDVSPEELIKRLQEGKIFNNNYKNATENYFQKNTLNALRSICLKATADEVEDDLFSYMQQKNITLNWHVAERIMIFVDSEVSSQKLIIRGERMAKKFNSDLFVVYLKRESFFDFTNSQNTSIEERLKEVSESLGAKYFVIQEKEYIKTLYNFMKANYITFVLIGNSESIKGKFKNFIKMSMITKLIKKTDGVEFHIVPI
ncbi:sensor histidine kinase KdpD [Clostridium folliculivorans]|uniref:Sensor histidine kinase n=1 Tax=Clostridium folliculivorans TaxID=2886038 RepID=A0A9W6D8X2_9CLOT|nr:sensor histidine kinase KdpD [Clostridium folliculivorans]GKU23745.1 sensor histidine kinase [Clostridium folliculivorans]GKU29861.1 sensor histidine kinase [Clostridium folliculivorans]